MFRGHLILIISQIDLLLKWPPLPNSLGPAHWAKGATHTLGTFFILIHKCVHRKELNKTDMKKTFQRGPCCMGFVLKRSGPFCPGPLCPRGGGGKLNLLSLPKVISWLKQWLENKGNIMYHTKQSEIYYIIGCNRQLDRQTDILLTERKSIQTYLS